MRLWSFFLFFLKKKRLHTGISEKIWSNGIGLVTWNKMTQQYISTLEQNTLGRRNTGMFLTDATLGQRGF